MTTIDDPIDKFVDAHFHFDLFEDASQLLAEISLRNIATVAVTNAPSVFFHTLNVSRLNPYLLPAVGLHPELVGSHSQELSSLFLMLEQTKFVGEIGLDYVTNDLGNRANQRHIFSQIVDRCAAYGDKVLSIHSRRSASDVISIVGSKYPGRVILHWFSGSRRELERAIDYGFYFSVGPSMVHSKNGKALVLDIPKSQVLTESDGPFVQIDGRPARPGDVVGVVDKLSKIWNVSSSSAKKIISNNFDRLTTNS